MDSLRAFDDDASPNAGADDEPRMDAPPEIGTDERRMHVRAYNHWVSLLSGRPYPLITDLNPANVEDFGPNSVLLDFSDDPENPKIRFMGLGLREECGLSREITHINQVPHRSLLSRLTDHYLQIIANCAPIGFEAEFISQRGHNTMYRGILMPYSSDGQTIDFIYGVINWRELADAPTTGKLAHEVDQALSSPRPAPVNPVWADGPRADNLEARAQAQAPVAPDAGLAERLDAARASAETAVNADGRSRSALYQALGQAYDFALAAEAKPKDYAALLKEAGLKPQARAPMTPVAKLVFGVGYDKARLTEFAAALSYAKRERLSQGQFASWLERFDGGLKGVVRAERRQRRPGSRPAAAPIDWEQVRAKLRSTPPLAYVQVPGEVGEFVVLLAKRSADGRLAIVAPATADPRLVEQAIRKTAR